MSETETLLVLALVLFAASRSSAAPRPAPAAPAPGPDYGDLLEAGGKLLSEIVDAFSGSGGSSEPFDSDGDGIPDSIR